MLKILFTAAVAVTAIALSGCVASHTWAPGPSQSAENFSRTKGQCKLMAMGADNGSGFAYAQGSPQFVGSYLGAFTIDSAIGSHNRQQSAFNACMEAQGFVEVNTPGDVDVNTPGDPTAVPSSCNGRDHPCSQ
jgi:hypothetical protein